MTEAPPKKGMPGWVFVALFLLFCTIMAAGTVVVTWSAQFEKPTVDKPPEIGHELVPSR